MGQFIEDLTLDLWNDEIRDQADRIKALETDNARLLAALKSGADLIRGDAVGKEWKLGCAEFLRLADAMMAERSK